MDVQAREVVAAAAAVHTELGQAYDGAVAGGLSVFLTSRAQMRRELEYAYDRELRARRIEAYMSLYKRTDKLPRYWRTNPKRMELSDFSYAFDGWYFGEAGGLFLSDKARD